MCPIVLNPSKISGIDAGKKSLGSIGRRGIRREDAYGIRSFGRKCGLVSGVVIMIFPGTPEEERSLGRLAALSAECELLGLPVMAESIPGGWPQHVPWTPENVGRGARIAIELGADIVKTMCPGPTAEFGEVVAACPGPVVALGGPKAASEDDVVEMAHGVVAAGGAGVAIGRNVWGSDDPAALVRRLREAVHGANE